MKLKDFLQRLIQLPEEAALPKDLEQYLSTFVPETLMKHETFQKAFGITDYELEQLYAYGYKQYQKKQYEEAIEYFRLLAILNPYTQKYWMGYGACQQVLGDAEKALHSYAVALFLNEDNPFCHYHAHECYLMMNNQEEAKIALSCAVDLCKDRIEYAKLLEHIKNVEDKLFTH